MDNYVFRGLLGLDTSEWRGGFESAGRDLKDFSADTVRNFASASKSANLSIKETIDLGRKLASILGTDIKSASLLLADALTKPTEGLNALSKAGLNVTESLRDEVSSMLRAGREYDAHDAIVNRITQSYEKLNSTLDDLDFSGEAYAASANAIAMEEAAEHAAKLAEIEEHKARTFEYEKHLLDELNAKHAEQVELAKKAQFYRDLPSGGPRSFLEKTQSEAAAEGGFGLGGLGSLAQVVPGGLGTVATGGFAAVVSLLGAKSLSEFAAAEQLYARLEAVLKATGYAAGFTAEQLKEQASQLQSQTTFTDNAITEAQIFLSTLKDIKGDTFTEVMHAAADLAIVMDTDLPSAAQALGRALVDPENGLGRLQRAGITLSESQKTQVASFMKLGEVAKAQQIILDEVASRTGGAAAAAADTLSGRWEKLKNEASKLGEEVGGYLAPVFDVFVKIALTAVRTIQWMIEKVESLFDFMKKVRIEWNLFTGDFEEANRLQGELDKKKEAKEGPKNLAVAKPDVVNQALAAGGRNGVGVSASTAAALTHYISHGSASTDNADPFSGVNDRFKRSASEVSFSKQYLQKATPDQALKFVSGLRDEIDSAVKKGGLKFGMLGGKPDVEGFDKLIAIYKSRLELMPGYNKQVFEKMQGDVMQSLKLATATQGDMRKFYLEAVAESLKSSEKMFEDYQRRLDESEKLAKEKAEQAGKWTTEAGKMAEKHAFLQSQGLEKKPGADGHVRSGRQSIDARSSSIGSSSSRGRSTSTSSGGAAVQLDDYYKGIADSSDRDLVARMASMSAETRSSNSFMKSIASPEQMRGIVQLQQAWMQAMNAIRNSTGDVRLANVEELKRIEAAWQEAQEAIRTGSKKTADQLAQDAKKEGDASKKAAKSAATQGQLYEPSTADQLSGMSRQYSGMLQGAFAGTNLFAGAGLADEFAKMNKVDKIKAEIQSTGVALSQQVLNQNAVGGVGRLVDSLRYHLTELTVQLGKAQAEQARERQQAEDAKNKRYQERQEQREKENREKDAEVLKTIISVGKNAGNTVYHIHGPKDGQEIVAWINEEKRKGGVNTSGLRSI